MSDSETFNWIQGNQRYLTMAMARIRNLLEQHIGRSEEAAAPAADAQPLGQDVSRLRADMPSPPALEKLCDLFHLSAFEHDLLLLTAAVELDSAYAALCARANGDSRKSNPTFSLAMSFLPEAHWSALTPVGPLRYWRLIEPGGGDALTTSPLRIDERILHYLTGVQYLDERLKGFVKPVSPPVRPSPLTMRSQDRPLPYGMVRSNPETCRSCSSTAQTGKAGKPSPRPSVRNWDSS